MSWNDFVKSRGGNGQQVAGAQLDSFLEEFPLLGAFFGRYVLADGRPVAKMGSMTFFFEGGRFKVCLNDHHASLKGFLTLSNASHVYAEIEIALQEGTVDWKPEKRRS